MPFFSLLRLVTGGACMALVVACAPPPPEPMRLSPQPSYNKMGELESCGQGYSIRDQRCVPDDECYYVDQTGREVPCPPPGRDPGDDDDGTPNYPDPQ